MGELCSQHGTRPQLIIAGIRVVDRNMDPQLDEPQAVLVSDTSTTSKSATRSTTERSRIGSNPLSGTESELNSVGNGVSIGSGSEASDNGLDNDKETDSRKIRRIMANRRSARESRERRKQLLNDLQDSVDRLSTENSELVEQNRQMREELAILLQEAGLDQAQHTRS